MRLAGRSRRHALAAGRRTLRLRQNDRDAGLGATAAARHRLADRSPRQRRAGAFPSKSPRRCKPPKAPRRARADERTTVVVDELENADPSGQAFLGKLCTFAPESVTFVYLVRSRSTIDVRLAESRGLVAAAPLTHLLFGTDEIALFAESARRSLDAARLRAPAPRHRRLGRCGNRRGVCRARAWRSVDRGVSELVRRRARSDRRADRTRRRTGDPSKMSKRSRRVFGCAPKSRRSPI